MNTCKTCKYFQSWEDDGENEGMGDCMSNITSINPEGVHESFGCICWEPQDDKTGSLFND